MKLGKWLSKVLNLAAHEAIEESNQYKSRRKQAIKFFVSSIKCCPSSFDYKLLMKILFHHFLSKNT
jgi:hypothetical protein